MMCGGTSQNLVEATEETALCTMLPVANQAGTWAAGPAFPPRRGKPAGRRPPPQPPRYARDDADARLST
jgi:hypothetical protein